MKLSELAQQIQEHIEQYGDVELVLKGDREQTMYDDRADYYRQVELRQIGAFFEIVGKGRAVIESSIDFYPAPHIDAIVEQKFPSAKKVRDGKYALACDVLGATVCVEIHTSYPNRLDFDTTNLIGDVTYTSQIEDIDDAWVQFGIKVAQRVEDERQDYGGLAL